MVIYIDSDQNKYNLLDKCNAMYREMKSVSKKCHLKNLFKIDNLVYKILMWKDVDLKIKIDSIERFSFK